MKAAPSSHNRANRRDFLKKSLIAGVGTSAVAAGVAEAPLGKSETVQVSSGVAKGREVSFSLFRKEHDTIDDVYEISKDYEQMDQKNIMFVRSVWDPKYYVPRGQGISFFLKDDLEVPNPNTPLKGFGRLEQALGRAAWAGHEDGTPKSKAGMSNKGPLNDWERHSNPDKAPYDFPSKEEASKIVKRAARFLGADEVGIAPYDERWTYSKEFDLMDVAIEGKSPEEARYEDIKFPFKVKSVIALSFEMDYDAMKAPGLLPDSAVGLEYSHMAEVSHKLAVFLNKLGYKAIPAGNDTGLSIPIAAQAGLGELSRMGTLISEKYGSRIRLAKVYTDLELKHDKPITFGVHEFCVKCKKCAEACPSEAISLEDQPSVEPTVDSISTNPGVKKWYQNNEKCFGYWEKLGVGCAICISVCPYNKIDNWVHDLSKLVVSAPVGRDIARQLDDAFGYGKRDMDAVDDFWNKED